MSNLHRVESRQKVETKRFRYSCFHGSNYGDKILNAYGGNRINVFPNFTERVLPLDHRGAAAGLGSHLRFRHAHSTLDTVCVK